MQLHKTGITCRVYSQIFLLMYVLSMLGVQIISAQDDCTTELESLGEGNYIVYSTPPKHNDDNYVPEIDIIISDLRGTRCRLDLYVDVSESVSYLPGYTVSGTYPVWSPNGDTIAFIGSMSTIDSGRVSDAFDEVMYERYPGIYHRDPILYFYRLGLTERLFVSNSDEPYVGPLSWQPNGDHISVWSTTKDDNEQTTFGYTVFEANSRGIPVRTVSGAPNVGMFAWSPHQTMWVVAHPSLSLLSLNQISEMPETLMGRDFEKQNPAWTPDGITIGFATNREGTFDIFTILADGTGLERITFDDTSNEDYPVWSPDGEWLAYLQSDANAVELEYQFMFRRWTGENTYTVTPPMPIWEHYKWLPDNSGLLFYMQVEDDQYALHWLEIECLTSDSGCTETAFKRIPNTETTQYLGFDVTDNMNLQFNEDNK